MTASTIGAFACRSRYVSLKPSRQGATPPKIGKPSSGPTLLQAEGGYVFQIHIPFRSGISLSNSDGY